MPNQDPPAHSERNPAAVATEDAASEVHKLVKERMDKAEKIRAAGMDPYANDFRPELTCIEFRAHYAAGTAEELEKINTVCTLAGRIIAMRNMGKASFLTIRDATGDLQIYVKKDRVGDRTYELLKLCDIGDIVGIAGTPMKTKTGELTVGADGFRVLTKALRDAGLGKEYVDKDGQAKSTALADTELRYRQRYADLIVHPDVRRVFRTRAKIVRGIQAYLDKRGFLEVETPILQDMAGGATAKPFVTHHNELGQDMYLRIATELHLKRLVVGGLERVYEIGRNFRNEGVSTRHNPEFTSIEVYQAYATYLDLMELTEDVVCELVAEIHERNFKVTYGERTIDFARPWRRAPIATLVAEHLGIQEDLTQIHSVAQALAITVGHTAAPDEPLHVVLRELSDDEAEKLIPGMPAPVPLAKGTAAFDAANNSIAARAKMALKAGGDGFWKKLGQALDDAWKSVDAFEQMPEPDVTVKGMKAVKASDFDEDTGEISLIVRRHDEKRARRRRLALALLYSVFDHEVERTLTNPTFITDFSVSVSPLARKRDADPAVVDRFELIVGGMELANAFSELNDPVDQRNRFLDQLREKERGDAEAHDLDEDYVRALEIGMPPTAGLGIGIDRLVMVLTNQQSIRDVVLFPAMKRVSST